MTVSPHQPNLILWDIDRTLVTIGEVGREMYESAFEEVVGRPLRRLADMAGRIEQAILADTLRLHGVVNSAYKFDDICVALTSTAVQLRARMHAVRRSLPGAEKALAALAKPNVVQTVVTGNIKSIAVMKLMVIGDTPLDVAAAREVGVRAIGVATGGSGIKDLMMAQADTVLPDLTDTEAVIRALCPAVLA